ncbi:hypothetical protein MK805_12640 [Shimazuella sp. AN120528]|uniref:hypothetical protein n=1 Tax=Shimazuella soli TaxID=1892854 RepID=UPI001F0F191C|nr:hypothetical protein [Shimazuella soli]MCH5585791.1 hypothetical protein [Shimazuella soli]
MKDLSRNIQVVSFLNRVQKDIRLHLENGEKIDIPLWDTKMIDMGNGHLFVIGKVLDQKVHCPAKENVQNIPVPWKL